MEAQAFVGPVIHSLAKDELEIIPQGVVVVAGGKIQKLERSYDDLEKLIEQYKVTEGNVRRLVHGQFLMPGMIDTHIHAPQYPNAGLGYDMELLNWLQTYTFPLEKKFSNLEFARKVYSAVVQRTIANGSTTCCYFATIHLESSLLLADLAEEYGQRAFIGKVNMNVNTPEGYGETTEASLADTEIFINKVLEKRNSLVQPIITPRFAITCDMPLLKGLAELARKYDVRVQTHVSENQSEIEAVHGMFPDCEDYATVYDKAGLLTRKVLYVDYGCNKHLPWKPQIGWCGFCDQVLVQTILAHGVHLTDNEVKLMAEKGTSLAHCPNSNTMLSSGACSSSRLLDAGVVVGLGTDCAGGYSVSLLDNLRHAIQTSIHCTFTKTGRRLSTAQAFYLATLAGAQALSIEDTTGNFQPGKDFDALLININASPATELLQDYSLEQLLQKFIYLGDDRCIENIFIAGRQVK